MIVFVLFAFVFLCVGRYNPLCPVIMFIKLCLLASLVSSVAPTLIVHLNQRIYIKIDLESLHLLFSYKSLFFNF